MHKQMTSMLDFDGVMKKLLMWEGSERGNAWSRQKKMKLQNVYFTLNEHIGLK